MADQNEQPINPSRLTDDAKASCLVQIYLNEFSAMRSEVLQLSTKQQYFLVTSFAVTAYGFSQIVQPAISSSGNQNATYNGANGPLIWFVLCLVLCAIGLLFCDADLAIVRCATYIERYLKPRLGALFDGNQGATGKILEIFGWEVYIRATHSRHKPFNSAVYGLFIAVPALGCLLLFCQYSIFSQQPLIPNKTESQQLPSRGALIKSASHYFVVVPQGNPRSSAESTEIFELNQDLPKLIKQSSTTDQKPPQQLDRWVFAEYVTMVLSFGFLVYRLYVVSLQQVTFPPATIRHRDRSKPANIVYSLVRLLKLLGGQALFLCIVVSTILGAIFCLLCLSFATSRLTWSDFISIAIVLIVGELIWFGSYERAVWRRQKKPKTALNR